MSCNVSPVVALTPSLLQLHWPNLLYDGFRYIVCKVKIVKFLFITTDTPSWLYLIDNM